MLIAIFLQVYTVTVKDTTTEQKVAENLLNLMKEVVQLLENDWQVKVSAFTTNASGESHKAHCLLQAQYPHLVTPDCHAHQASL